MKTAAQSRSQALLMLAFPVTLAPVALAYLARYAFDTEWAFFGVLLFGAVVGVLVYFYSMQSALKAAVDRREQIISASEQRRRSHRKLMARDAELPLLPDRVARQLCGV